MLTKMHVHGSKHNVQLLSGSGVKYEVVVRDLRDVAVSAVFYIQSSRWHPEFCYYDGLPVEEGLQVFAHRTLKEYMKWVRSWHQNYDPDLGLIIRYEQILESPDVILTEIANHFELDSSAETVSQVVEIYCFEKSSGGKKHGQEGKNSFFRKGISGDWRNYFTPELKDTYKDIFGNYLVDYGYEKYNNW